MSWGISVTQHVSDAYDMFVLLSLGLQHFLALDLATSSGTCWALFVLLIPPRLLGCDVFHGAGLSRLAANITYSAHERVDTNRGTEGQMSR